MIVLLTSIIGTFFDILSRVETWTKIDNLQESFRFTADQRRLRVLDQSTFIAANFKHPSGYAVGHNPKEQSVVYKTAGCRSPLQQKQNIKLFPKLIREDTSH